MLWWFAHQLNRCDYGALHKMGWQTTPSLEMNQSPVVWADSSSLPWPQNLLGHQPTNPQGIWLVLRSSNCSLHSNLLLLCNPPWWETLMLTGYSVIDELLVHGKFTSRFHNCIVLHQFSKIPIIISLTTEYEQSPISPPQMFTTA